MTLNDNMRSLVELLTQGTRKKRILWEANSNLDYFSAGLGNGSAELIQHMDGDAFNLLIRNANGQLLDQTGYLSQNGSLELAELAREVRGMILKNSDGLANIISGLREKVTSADPSLKSASDTDAILGTAAGAIADGTYGG